MRIQNEQSGSSSLFAQPMALEAVPEAPDLSRSEGEPEAVPDAPRPEAGGKGSQTLSARKGGRPLLEARMEAVLSELLHPGELASATVRQGHLALLKRWYYRPEAKRTGRSSFLMAKATGRSKPCCAG